MKTRLAFASAGLIVLALIAWLLAPAQSSTAASKRAEPAVIAVDAATATRRDVPVYLDGLGTIQAFYTVKVTARVDGQLTRIAFTEGQRVKRGQLLAEIDPRPYRAALDQALATRAKDRAQLANARKDLARYRLLEPKHLASQQTLDAQQALVAQLEAQLQADKAAIESAQTQLSYTRITSPIDGRTGIRLVDPGNIVRSSDTTPIVVITQTQPIAAIVTLPEKSLGAVAEAMSHGAVSVSVVPRESTLGSGGAESDSVESDSTASDSTASDSAVSGSAEPDGATSGAAAAPEQGKVQLIDNQIDQATGTVRLKAIFPNARERLWPGEFVRARVLVRTERNALTIPAFAQQRGPDGLFAYVIRPDSTVEARPLKVGYDDQHIAVIEGGLKDGERVAMSNFYRLQPGALVRVNQPERTSETAARAGAPAANAADPTPPAGQPPTPHPAPGRHAT